MQCQAASARGVERANNRSSMDTYRAPTRSADAAADADDPDELGVFAAERYFYGDDDDDDVLWPSPCERSSSSLSSAFRTGTGTGTGTHEHDRAVTSSSEASWNSRSALLPTSEPRDKLHDVASAAAAPFIEARRSASGSGTRPASSSNLRRWLLGVAACGCAGGASHEEESASADEMEETSERFPGTKIPEAPVTAASVALTPGSARWLLESDKTLAGIGIDGHRRASATNLGELSTPIWHPKAAAATSDSHERRRIKSLEMFRPVPVPVPVLGSATQQSSAFTIVAGNTALGFGGEAPAAALRAASGAGRGRGSPAGEDDDDDNDDAAARSELGRAAYAPSEASVVWSVVTADGAASGNFSSAASGYYCRYYLNDAAAAAKSTRSKRRSGIASGSSLLTCMSDRAVDAVGPAPSVHRQQEVQTATVATLGASAGSRNGLDGVYYKPTRT